MSETLGSLQYRISKTPLGAGIDSEVLLGYVNDRIEEICRLTEWQRLKKASTIQTVDEYVTGTIDLAVGASAGTGTGTTFTAAMTGRRIRPANLLEYYIFTRVSNTSFTIDRPFENDDDLDDAAFTIFQPIYALPSDLREVTSLRNPTLGIELQEVDRNYINRNAASRINIESPRLYAPYPDSSDGLPQIELYPAPSEAVGLPLEYIAQAPFFTIDDTDELIPDWISIPCLRAGVEAELCKLHHDYQGKQVAEMDFMRLLGGVTGENARSKPATETNMANRYTEHRAQRTMRHRGRGALRNWRSAS